MEYNLLYQTEEPAKIFWGGTYSGVTAFQIATGKGTGCLETNPLFIDPTNGDFNLQDTSPVNNLEESSKVPMFGRILILPESGYSVISTP